MIQSSEILFVIVQGINRQVVANFGLASLAAFSRERIENARAELLCVAGRYYVAPVSLHGDFTVNQRQV